MERGDLPFELRHQVARLDRRMRRDVVDRLLRIQRRALAADLGQGVDQHAGQLQHAQLEHREQADRAGADDRDVGLDVASPCRPRLNRVRCCPQLRRCGRLASMSAAAATRLIELPDLAATERAGRRGRRPGAGRRRDPAGGRAGRRQDRVRPRLPARRDRRSRRWRCPARPSPWCRATTRRRLVHHFDLWRLDGPGRHWRNWAGTRRATTSCWSNGRTGSGTLRPADALTVALHITGAGQPARRAVRLARPARPHRMTRRRR